LLAAFAFHRPVLGNLQNPCSHSYKKQEVLPALQSMLMLMNKGRLLCHVTHDREIQAAARHT